VFLGIYFTVFQGTEYYEAPFSISDSVYGSTFFIATGFHGLHVFIGTTFLFICLIRRHIGRSRGTHHFGLKAAIWY
jgi:cytochrome c oxidase subunit 3